MWKLLALFPCLFLVAAADEGGCSALLACENSISEENLFAEEATLMTYSDAQILDHLCTEIENLTNCIDDKIGGCDDVTITNELDTDKQLIEYMCSDKGQEIILSLASNDCVDDPLLELNVQNMLQGCLESFTFYLQMEAIIAMSEDRQLQMSDLCPYVDELKVCLVNGGEDLCGPDLGQFFGDIWDIASATEFEELGCGASAERKRRYVKRALPMLMKRSNMLKKLRK